MSAVYLYTCNSNNTNDWGQMLKHMNGRIAVIAISITNPDQHTPSRHGPAWSVCNHIHTYVVVVVVVVVAVVVVVVVVAVAVAVAVAVEVALGRIEN
jgi:hypothetical protein